MKMSFFLLSDIKFLLRCFDKR